MTLVFHMRVSVDKTVQGPSVRSVNFHPTRSSPVSEDGRCRVEAVSGALGAFYFWCWSTALNLLSSCRHSSRWVLVSGSCVSFLARSCKSEVMARSWSNLLAPGATSGAGYRMMLSDVRIFIMSWIRQRYDR